MKAKMRKMKTPCSVLGAPTLRDCEGSCQCLSCESGFADDTHEVSFEHPTLSPAMGEMLVDEVVPRLWGIVHTISKVGHEDDEEVVADATLMAARMMASADLAGRSFSGGNMAWFAAKAARSGRRSGYTGASDVMSPRCQFQNKARHEWIDLEVEMECGDVGSLHDVIASSGYQGHETDPSEEAARNLDWKAFLARSPEKYRIAVDVLLSGGSMREAGQRCGLKDSAALNLKRRIGADLLEFFGEETIRRLLHGVSPNWESDLRMSRERTHQSHEDSFRPQP